MSEGDLVDFLDRIGTGCAGRVWMCNRSRTCDGIITNDPNIALRACTVCDRLSAVCICSGPTIICRQGNLSCERG